ncbi:MAG: beta-lactamase family protein [Phycisphaerales bacterium]|nr:MAG: beta-lactamase family protein [Phycisphaerales bacterium]
MKLTRVALTLLLCLVVGCRTDHHVRRVEYFSEIGAAVEEEIEKGNFPGAVVLVGKEDNILYWEAFGREVNEPFQEPVEKNTIFDLASMTKPIATATSIMILRDRGAIELDDRVGKYLPAFACNGKEKTQIRHLLTHTSGLPAYTNASALEEEFGNPCPDKVIEKICGLHAASEPGERFRYSCLGYIALARIVEVVSGKDIADFSRRNVYARLGMKKTAFNPPGSWQRHIAATEIVEGQLLRGTVHDPLARLMDGTSGNAGLFSNVYDLSIYCRMLLSKGVLKRRRILSPEAVAMLTTEQSHGRALGFDVNSSYSWVKGDHAPDGAFCHTGYTGTSIVCDPDSGLFVIILTNRAHPKDGGATKPVRKKVANIVFSSLSATSSAQ